MKAGNFVSVLLILILSGGGQRLTGQGRPLSPQTISMLSGRVFDRNGAVVVGSEVLLTGYRGAKFRTATNEEGIYRVDLPAGFYNLQIRANGFSTFSLECYQIPLEGRINLDVTLKVSGESGCGSGLGKEGSDTSPPANKKKTIIIE